MNAAQMQKMNQDQAKKNAIEQLDRVADLAQRLVQKMAHRRGELEICSTNDASEIVHPHDVMGWAMNDIENMLRNVNFAELATHVSRLQTAYTK